MAFLCFQRVMYLPRFPSLSRKLPMWYPWLDWVSLAGLRPFTSVEPIRVASAPPPVQLIQQTLELVQPSARYSSHPKAGVCIQPH